MKKIRLLFLPQVDGDNTNAQSLNTREIVLRLDPQQFEIALFYRDSPDSRLLGREHIRLMRLPSHLKTLRLLREMFSGYDIIAYMDYSPASYFYAHLPAVCRGRTKTVLHAEGPVRLGDATLQLHFLFRGVVSNCDVYTAITRCVARDCARVLGRRAKFILPVGVDCGFFTPRVGEPENVPIVLFVGTLMKNKAPLLVLEAAARFPNAKFRMIGADRHGYAQVVKQRIAELDLRNVVLEGRRSQAEIAQAMRESDVFLLPSRAEGLPKVTLEAAASGLPCIVFRDYETPSVLDGVTGFQVGTNDEMMERLGILFSDLALRKSLGCAARRHAEKFDWAEVAGQWERAYLEIAASSSS